MAFHFSVNAGPSARWFTPPGGLSPPLNVRDRPVSRPADTSSSSSLFLGRCLERPRMPSESASHSSWHLLALAFQPAGAPAQHPCPPTYPYALPPAPTPSPTPIRTYPRGQRQRRQPLNNKNRGVQACCCCDWASPLPRKGRMNFAGKGPRQKGGREKRRGGRATTELASS